MALLRGPVCLFHVTDAAADARAMTVRSLLQAEPVRVDATQFRTGSRRFKPFAALAQDEQYSLYVKTIA
jgi:hypothetical protein